MSRGTGLAFSVLGRVTGVDLLRDLRGFLGAFGEVLDGFRERATGVKALLADPATTFLIVTSPETPSRISGWVDSSTTWSSVERR